ncbi:MAG: hypothetical protein MK101_00865 [Phycisphaerales bacterium]|nr:hypothetical protein [Phycisphaerales bacterium]
MRRGALLLEVLVALVILVGAGAFTLQAMDDAEQALDRADRRRRCNDAAVAIVRMAGGGLVGIGDLRSESLPELLEMSVYAGDADLVELETSTSPSAEPGLVLLEVTVREIDDPDLHATVRALVPSDLRLQERMQ